MDSHQQFQSPQEPIRLTEQEAAAMVELHARMNAQADKGPTLRDVAEVLRISDAEALALFNRVREESAPAREVAVPAKRFREKRHLLFFSLSFLTLCFAFILALTAIRSQQAVEAPATVTTTPAMETPVRAVGMGTTGVATASTSKASIAGSPTGSVASGD